MNGLELHQHHPGIDRTIGFREQARRAASVVHLWIGGRKHRAALRSASSHSQSSNHPYRAAKRDSSQDRGANEDALCQVHSETPLEG